MACFDLRAGYCPGELVATILLNFGSVNVVQVKIPTLDADANAADVLCRTVEKNTPDLV